MPHVADRLNETIASTGSVACVGLDPRTSMLPPILVSRCTESAGPGAAGVAEAFSTFNRSIIDAIAGRCACVKIQAACYEAYGSQGWRALEDTVAHASAAGIPVILDAKRNDIGSTAAHYRQAFRSGGPGLNGEEVGGLNCDWLTANGYLGHDGIGPLLGEPGEGGVFVLVKTSNPGSAELQGQPSGEGLVMDRMANLVRTWGSERLGSSGLSDIGAVVGATWPDEARRLRERMPDTIFLVPGYGAQGGSAADALAGRRADGKGVIVNSSRGIIAAWQDRSHGEWSEDDWSGAARAALDRMNEDLGSV